MSTPTSSSIRKPIRIGLLGAGNWALHGHVRVLNLLPDYELIAVYARRREASEKAAKDHGFGYVVDTVEEVVNHPEVDLVVVATLALQHADGVRAALAAGKDVYCEWPLATTTAVAQELVALAQNTGVRHVVGLQRRLAPHNCYVKDLLDQGFVGKLRSVRIHVSVNFFGGRSRKAHAWTAQAEHFTHVVSIYAGHFLEMMFTAAGWPSDISARQLNQFPVVTIEETGEVIEATSLNQLVLIGRIGESTALSAHIEGGKQHGSGVQIDITGQDGDLRITNRSAFGGVGDDYVVEGATGDRQALEVMPVPASYDSFPGSGLPSSVLELGELYAAYARDVTVGTHTAPTFEDALRMHTLLDAIAVSTTTGNRGAL